MITCKICGKEYINFFAIGTHISQGHKIHTKDYYDKYLKKENEGKCTKCGKSTNFLNLNIGYFEFCSKNCSNNAESVKIKKENTLYKNYKVKSPFHSEIIQQRIQKTNLERHGNINANKSEKVKEKRKQTCLKKFKEVTNLKCKENKDKSIKTCMEKYHVSNPMMDKNIQNKVRDFYKTHVAYMTGRHLSLETKKKLSNSLKNNPNVGGYRHGCKSGRGKSGWYKGFWCDSSWELAFIIFCIDYEIPVQRNLKKFKYEFGGKYHHWYPDFLIDGCFFEIKGWIDERVKEKFLSFNNPLIILYEEDLKFVFKYVREKYGKDFISLYEGNPHNQKLNKCIICGQPARKLCCSPRCTGLNSWNSKNNKLRKIQSRLPDNLIEIR